MFTTAAERAEMGKIVTQVTVTNRADEIRAASGVIPPEAIRYVVIESAVVDTGATTLCLPPQVIAQLGLELQREVGVATAHGRGRARIFQDAKMSLLGREGTFECLELPGGSDALIGVIPLEALGIELDLQNQRLRLLPDTTDDTYYTAYGSL